MSAIVIKEVKSERDLSKFIRFNYELYKDNAYAVPDFFPDTHDTFTPSKNAAYEFCEAALYLAYRDDKLVGRVAAIINHRANETWKQNKVRFGWIDFVDDEEVSRALIEAVEVWGKQKGMDVIEGPLGFTDLDPEGMLVEGFDQPGTMATIYNYPYYPKHIEKLGFVKETDWTERKIMVPSTGFNKQEKYFRVAEIVKKRYNVHVRKFTGMKDLNSGDYGHKIFTLLNKAYSPLFGFSRLSERQIDQYVHQYLPFADWRMVTVVEDSNNNVIAFGISIPSLSDAIRKAKGKLFPFGWYHLLKALKWKHSKVIDLLLIAVDPEWQGSGVNALLFSDLIPVYREMGFEYAESHPVLETNQKSIQLWDYLENTVHKRRRCYKKSL
jgi:GNAT superfamily N-acetyltransferase